MRTASSLLKRRDPSAPELPDKVTPRRPGPPDPDDQELRQERLHEAAETYLKGDLTARLTLSQAELFRGNYQNAVAQSAQGKLLLKFYPDHAAYKIHRCCFAHRLMERSGLKVADIVYADASPEGLAEHGLSCVVTRWVEGKPLAIGDRAATDRAFGLLGQLHRITFDELDEDLRQDFARSLTRPADNAPELTQLRYEIGEISQVPEAVTAEEARVVETFLAARLEEARGFKLPRALLHMDYQPGNLICTPDDEIVLIDFEGCTFGGFHLDLARALFKFIYKTNSPRLDVIGIDELIRNPKFDSLLEAYFAEAPSETRAFWDEHRATLAIWGYLKTVRSLAQKAVRQRRSGWFKRSRTVWQLRHRWNKVLRYVERAERT